MADLRVLMCRMRNKIRPEISEVQFGFVADKGTRNAIFTLNMLLERSIEVQKDIYLCFIDYSKAFDKVRHEDLFNILSSLNIDAKDMRILINLYWEQLAAIRIENETSDYRPIKRGVRQGCVLSPDLFNLYSEMILRNIEELNGVKVGGREINNLRYADDTVLIADSEQKLQSLLTTASVKSEERGLQLNAKKTECMVVSKNPNAPTCKISCNGVDIKQVKTFKYLGCNITQDARSDCEIKKRIAMAKDTFCKMKTIFTNRNINIFTKIETLRAYVWSILLYGCESWTLSKNTEKKLEATEMWFIRRMLRISWTEKKSNTEVMEEAGYQRSLIKTIRKRQMQFLGHICRKDGIEKHVLCGKIEGKRSRGRQRNLFINSLNKYATDGTITNAELIRRTEDREVWRAMVVDVCSRPDT